jgi:hypothetical protein
MNLPNDDEHELELLQEYDFSEGVRGKYVGRFAVSVDAILLDKDVTEVVPDSE